MRHALDGVGLPEENQVLAEMLRRAGAGNAEEAIQATGRARGVAGVPDEIQRLFATAHDVPARAFTDARLAIDNFDFDAAIAALPAACEPVH